MPLSPSPVPLVSRAADLLPASPVPVVQRQDDLFLDQSGGFPISLPIERMDLGPDVSPPFIF